jgi:hypothetical protein
VVMLYTHAFLLINLRTIYVYKLYIYPVNRYMVYTCIYIGKRINVISLIVRGHAKFMVSGIFQVYLGVQCFSL